MPYRIQRTQTVKRLVLTGLVLIALAIIAWLLAPFFTPTAAQARTRAQATNDAIYYSAVDCPHHGSGKCLKRDSRLINGLGHGRWSAETRGWECLWFEPCAFYDYTSARWYYTRLFIIENNGTRSHVSGFTADG
jgi:hypothetical protein